MSDTEYLLEMGSKIKSARLANRLSLNKLGKKCGLHLTSLWFIENGRSNVHILVLKSIAEALNMDVKDFL